MLMRFDYKSPTAKKKKAHILLKNDEKRGDIQMGGSSQASSTGHLLAVGPSPGGPSSLRLSSMHSVDKSGTGQLEIVRILSLNKIKYKFIIIFLKFFCLFIAVWLLRLRLTFSTEIGHYKNSENVQY